LTGEYAVLDGAKSLALPTKRGQSLSIKSAKGADLSWVSLDSEGKKWFESSISLYDFSPTKTTSQEISDKLQKILKNAVRLNSEFLSQWNVFKIETKLEFPNDWGLGSSSTLYDLVAQWADVDPLELYLKSENGSGYDVACAAADAPLLYQSTDENITYREVDFKPSFVNKLWLVHLGNKQSSSEGIKAYHNSVKNRKQLVDKISEITESLLKVKSLNQFEELMERHEQTIAEHTGFEPIKEKKFKDFNGCVKSLGAWGGDFVLVTSNENPSSYFKKHQMNTVIPYSELIL